MTRHFACLFAFTSILLSPLIASAAPLEAYARLPVLFNVTISSDGKQLAYVTDVDGKRSVIVYAIDSAKVVTALNLGTRSLKTCDRPTKINFSSPPRKRLSHQT